MATDKKTKPAVDGLVSPTQKVVAILAKHFPTHQPVYLLTVAELIHRVHADAMTQENHRRKIQDRKNEEAVVGA